MFKSIKAYSGAVAVFLGYMFVAFVMTVMLACVVGMFRWSCGILGLSF
jgi:hypothetical protein